MIGFLKVTGLSPTQKGLVSHKDEDLVLRLLEARKLEQADFSDVLRPPKGSQGSPHFASLRPVFAAEAQEDLEKCSRSQGLGSKKWRSHAKEKCISKRESL